MNATRITRREALAAGLGTVVAGHGATVAMQKRDENKSWVGSIVMPRRYAPTAQLRHGQLGKGSDGKPVELPVVLSGASQVVRGEEGSRVEVFDGENFFCWIAQDELILLGEAEAFFSKALAAQKQDFFALSSRAWAYYLSGKLDRAIADYGTLLKIAPYSPAGALERWEVLVNRALVLAEQGEFTQALADLEQSLRFAPSSKLARVDRGYTYELMGEYEKAVSEYSDTLHPLAVNNLAWLRATCPDEKFRDAALGVKDAQLLCEATSRREGMFIDTLAAARATAGRFDDAVKAQKEALEDPAFNHRYGDEARKRLRLYQDKKPFRSEPVKKK